MAEPNTDLFSGSGATGVPPDEAASASARLELLAHWGRLEAWKESVDLWPKKGFCDDPRSPVLRYCNPGKYNKGGYDTIKSYTQAERDAQTNTLLWTKIARSDLKQAWLEGCPWFDFRSEAIKLEILGATSKTRAEYIKVAAARYDLEPELVAGIILVEQRDQSEAEDIADAFSLGHGRMGTSIGLGQVRALSADIYGLLDDVIDINERAMTVRAVSWLQLLADEALNINATAKYLRLLANAAVEVQQHKTNSLLEKDSNCLKIHKPANGQYENLALLDLSVMGQHSKHWSTLPDSRMPTAVPANVLMASTMGPIAVTQDQWDEARSHYYLRVLASEYTSCPFDPTFLGLGVRRFDEQGWSTWVYRDNVSVTVWADFLPIAYEDCKRSPLLL